MNTNDAISNANANAKANEKAKAKAKAKAKVTVISNTIAMSRDETKYFTR
jgi:hypothetical protein